MTLLKRIKIVLLVLFFAIFLPGKALADLGHKPTMKFTIYRDANQKISDIQQIECKDSRCVRGNILYEIGPQGFGCEEDNACSSLAYGYTKYHRLGMKINGKKYESNIFETKGTDSYYKVYVTNNGVGVDQRNSGVNETLGYLQQFSIAVFITLFAELFVVLGFRLLYEFKLSKIIKAFGIANLTTLPVFWYIILALGVYSIQVILFFELVIMGYEALIYWLFLKKDGYSFWKILILSLVANIASFAITFILK